MTTSIWWIRRDLRLNDNQTLIAAQSQADYVIPLFIIDPRLWRGRWYSQRRTVFLVKNLKYWISNLTTQQKEAVSAWSTQLVPISEEWLLNREMIQAEARRLLSQKSSSPEFRAKLLDLIVNPELRRSSAYQRKIDTNIDLTIKFIIRLARQLTAKQRSYLLKRIESLATDFDKLSCDPKDVPIPRMNL